MAFQFFDVLSQLHRSPQRCQVFVLLTNRLLQVVGAGSLQDFAEFFDDSQVTTNATRSDLRDLARVLFDPSDYIVVELVPENFEG